MSFLPKSRKARTRLLLLAVIAPVVAVAVGLTLWGMRDSISLFYTPSQAAEARPAPGRAIWACTRSCRGSSGGRSASTARRSATASPVRPASALAWAR